MLLWGVGPVAMGLDNFVVNKDWVACVVVSVYTFVRGAMVVVTVELFLGEVVIFVKMMSVVKMNYRLDNMSVNNFVGLLRSGMMGPVRLLGVVVIIIMDGCGVALLIGVVFDLVVLRIDLRVIVVLVLSVVVVDSLAMSDFVMVVMLMVILVVVVLINVSIVVVVVVFVSPVVLLNLPLVLVLFSPLVVVVNHHVSVPVRVIVVMMVDNFRLMVTNKAFVGFVVVLSKEMLVHKSVVYWWNLDIVGHLLGVQDLSWEMPAKVIKPGRFVLFVMLFVLKWLMVAVFWLHFQDQVTSTGVCI